MSYSVSGSAPDLIPTTPKDPTFEFVEVEDEEPFGGFLPRDLKAHPVGERGHVSPIDVPASEIVFPATSSRLGFRTMVPTGNCDSSLSPHE